MAQLIRTYQVDAFTATAFGGNPAAVCLLPSSALPLSDAVRQQIAAEMNLSETAFLECGGHSGGAENWRGSHFKLRWFTPTAEVPLCGHATLASAAALLQGEGCDPSTVFKFDTLSGEVVVRAEPSAQPLAESSAESSAEAGQAASPLLCMDFPLIAAEAGAVPQGLEAGGSLVKALVGDLAVDMVAYAAPLRYLVVVLKTEGPTGQEALLGLKPDMQRVEAAYSGGLVAGVIVTVQGDSSPHDFLSRFFAPWLGIPEDPVTGSAHVVLGPLWSKRLGKAKLRARQCSRRGGELRVAVDEGKGRVEVAGHAVLVMEGNLRLPRRH